MFKRERRQVRADFGMIPELVDRYCPETPRDEAIKMARQVNVVNTYLSWMSTEQMHTVEGAVYGVAIAAMDEVTDELGEPLSDGRTTAAATGKPAGPQMEAVDLACELARGPRIKAAFVGIARWQDESLKQFGDMSSPEIRKVTEMKGGYSALGHLNMVKADPMPEEADFMRDFGTLMQLLDDYHDQSKDEDAGVSTMFTDGSWTKEDLKRMREGVLSRCKQLWGDGSAYRRFRLITRLHQELGWIENETRLRSSWLVPWYL